MPGRTAVSSTGRQTSDSLMQRSDFTKQARDEAKAAGISLVDGRDLYAKVDKVRRPELCEICQKPMLLGRSQHGWWFRCVNPGCNGKRHLGAEPGRAIELLTEPPLRTR